MRRSRGIRRAPLRFALHGARPNPANEQVVPAFETARESHVRIEVFDVQGRRVAEPVDRRMEAGRHTLPWLRRDAAGLRLAGGVYFVRMRAGAFRAEQRVVLSP